MSLILALTIEELMQPGFTGSDGVAGDPRSDANFSPISAAARRRSCRDRDRNSGF